MLELDWSTILWEIVNFLVITVILYFLVFRPMTKRAEARALEKAAAKMTLERNMDDSALKLEEIDDRLINLDIEIEQITDQAYAHSQSLQKELLEATLQEADQIMLEAVREARKEQTIDIKKNQAALVESVLSLTNQTLNTVTPPAVHESLIDELTERIWNLGRTDMRAVQNVRDSLEGRAPTVELATPKPLTREQHLKLVNTFNALTDNEVDLEITVDPHLVAGIKARIGDIVVDNTLGTQIEGMRAEVSKSLETLPQSENDD